MKERLNIVEERQAWTNHVLSTARISPAARARALGKTFYQIPAKTHLITVDCTKPGERKVELYVPAIVKTEPPSIPEAPFPHSLIGTIQGVFLDALWKAGYRLGKRRYMRTDLVCKARSYVYCYPRHVCMDLVRKLCPEAAQSTPLIGRHFGNMDHTTVLYALKQVPSRLVEWPVLAVAHAHVLAHFEAKQ